MTILHVNVVTKNVKDLFNEVKMERAFIIIVLTFIFPTPIIKTNFCQPTLACGYDLKITCT